MILHIDFETRSVANLPKVGLDNYAAHPTTDVWCMAYAFDDEPVQLCSTFVLVPERVLPHILAGGLVYAHNAAFEVEVWNTILSERYGWPPLRLEQMRCTMSMALAMGLPASLEHCAAALGIGQGKDMKGRRVMLQLSQPRSMDFHDVSDTDEEMCPNCNTPWKCNGPHVQTWQTPVWWDDPDKIETLFNYCKQDVEVERACHARMLELSTKEQALWVLYQKINARGIPVDLPSIDKAIALVASEKTRLDIAMRKVTGNVVAGCTDVTQLTAWLRYRGVTIPGVAKADVLDALADDSLPDDCRTALQLRQEAAKSSTAKLAAMRTGASADGRVRGCIQHHGAHTGRSAGRRVQPLNMPRPTLLKKPHHIDDAIAHLDAPAYLDMMYGNPMTILSDTLRGMICAPEGREFVCADFANIEGRVLAWLAGEDWKAQAFRDQDAGTGPDLYLVCVSGSRGIPIEECLPYRNEGKVEELACQYQGGAGAFDTWCKTYRMEMTDADKESRKNRWRGRHPATVKFWKGVESAAIRAVKEGGVHAYRSIRYVVKGSFLFCQLPSGRVLTYPYPRLERGKFGGDALSYMCVNSVSRKWERHHTYGGDLTNHVTQATARDIQTNAMLAVEDAGFGMVLEVYDEIVIEAPIGALSVDKVASLMTTLPPWAAGLPVAAEGWHGPRYRKD